MFKRWWFKFTYVFLCLMVTMSCLNRAALLSVQLVAVCQVFAGTLDVDQRSEVVFRGESVTLMCNASLENMMQINWNIGRDVFVYSMGKKTPNLLSHRMRINSDSPSRLDILDAQPDDTGLYTCTVTYEIGIPRITEWNLTVSEKPAEIPASSCPDCIGVYMPVVVIGCLLCGFASAVCLFRKIQTDLDQNTFSRERSCETLTYVWYCVQPEAKLASIESHMCVHYRMRTAKKSMFRQSCRRTTDRQHVGDE
ncbi:uncharacterized protein V6R79_026329 [Siganus canaliculatus]